MTRTLRRVRTPEQVAEAAAWDARRARYWTTHERVCALCGWPGPHRLGPFTVGPVIQLHHTHGRGRVCPVGDEHDAELLPVCVPCHRRITVRQYQLARRQGHMRGQTVLPGHGAGYSMAVQQATSEAWWRLWRIRRLCWVRLLYGSDVWLWTAIIGRRG